MERVFNLRGQVFAAIAWALICAVGMMPLRAQNGGGTLAGTVLDQVGKPIRRRRRNRRKVKAVR